MFGHDVAVRAAVERVPGLSGHADRSELLQWLGHLELSPKKTFLTHGEAESADALAAELRTSRGWDVVAPALGKSVELV
jgi:metallo-beta-lactamase family protein